LGKRNVYLGLHQPLYKDIDTGTAKVGPPNPYPREPVTGSRSFCRIVHTHTHTHTHTERERERERESLNLSPTLEPVVGNFCRKSCTDPEGLKRDADYEAM
jgi:hypothetical protein